MKVPTTFVNEKGTVCPMGRKRSGEYRRQKERHRREDRNLGCKRPDYRGNYLMNHPVSRKDKLPAPERMVIPTSLFTKRDENGYLVAFPGVRSMTAHQRKKQIALFRSGKKDLPEME